MTSLRTISRPTALLSAALLLGACANDGSHTAGRPTATQFEFGDSSGVYRHKRGALETGSFIPIEAESAEGFIATVTERMSSAGLPAAATAERPSVLSGSISDARLMDCGTVRFGPDADTATIPATAPSAVLPIRIGGQLGVVQREVDAGTAYDVALLYRPGGLFGFGEGYGVRLTENHDVTVTFSDAVTGQEISRKSLSFDGSGEGADPEGLTCRSSRELRSAVSD